MKKSSITLEKKDGKIVAVRVPVTSEIMRLAKGGVKTCGASVDQCIVWGVHEGLCAMRSAFEDGILGDNSHEPHLIKL